MRVYRPTVSRVQHFISMIDKETSHEVIMAMVKKCKDKAFLEELRDVIAKKLK